MPLYTAKYVLPYPVPADKADPVRDIKALADHIDSLLNVAYPIGTIVPFGGTVLPARWGWCDGTAHNSDALFAVTGSGLKPDLGGKFPVGAGTGYALAGPHGGLAKVPLTAAQVMVGAHVHTVTTNVVNTNHNHTWPSVDVLTEWFSADHGHIADPPATWMGGGGHEHGVVVNEGYDPEEGHDGNYVDTHPTPQYSDKLVGGTNGGGGHEHTMTFSRFASGAIINDLNAPWYSGYHGHTFNTPQVNSKPAETISGAGGQIGPSVAVAPSPSPGHENLPPYIAMRFIIKTGVLA